MRDGIGGVWEGANHIPHRLDVEDTSNVVTIFDFARTAAGSGGHGSTCLGRLPGDDVVCKCE